MFGINFCDGILCKTENSGKKSLPLPTLIDGISNKQTNINSLKSISNRDLSKFSDWAISNQNKRARRFKVEFLGNCLLVFLSSCSITSI